ncbi:MAG TPA: methylated-DNA--[protein]-cysteine S-methyltransferase [Vicinamibacterales bacterium]|nr:methylated-DNA--[protein]-cysteine S-methyltransferase [Vicinamibacterales bacterium]
MIRIQQLATPIGPLTLAAEGPRVCLLHFGKDGGSDGASVDRELARWRLDASRGAIDRSIVRALDRYFDGDLVALDTIDVDMHGTPFQKKVWDALRAIPAGETRSYGEIARRIDEPTAVRAVGAANGANPVAVIVPCHRVIGSNGTLTGYGGGLDRKRWLLAHEARHSGLFARKQG